MPDKSKLGKEAAKLIVILIITIINSLAISAAPLEVSVEEKINTTVNMTDVTDGVAVFSYQTNVTGYVNITNTGSDYIYDAWIAVDLVNNSTSLSLYYSNASSIVSVTCPPSVPPQLVNGYNFNYSSADCVIHIPLLKPGEVVSFFYDVDDASMGIANGSIFSVEEKYNVTKIPANRDVTWHVWFNVSLNRSWVSKTALDWSSLNLSLNVTKYLSNKSAYYGSENWVKLYLDNVETDKGSVNLFDSEFDEVNPPGTNDSFYVDNVILNTTNQYVNISFNVTGNSTISVERASYALEPFGFATFKFDLAGNVSGTKIVDVFAIGNASINVTKDGPKQNATGEWALWRGNATITNKASGLVYVVTNYTVWASNFTHPGVPLTDEYSGNQAIIRNPSNWQWPRITPGGFNKTPDLSFNYSGVPVIWANFTFKLIKSTSQGWWANNTTMHDYNAEYGSDYIVIERIYVIGTYLVKVTKHVLLSKTYDDGNATYDIYLVVENIGGEKSPYVYVYDMIPEGFYEYNWDDSWNVTTNDGNWVNQSDMFDGNGTISNPISGYRVGYWWRLKPLEPGADGDGNYEEWDEISNNQTVVIFYQINGTGDYKLLDAFIVGIDPMYSMNEQTSPVIRIVGGSVATSHETLMAVFSAAMAFVAIVTFRRRS